MREFQIKTIKISLKFFDHLNWNKNIITNKIFNMGSYLSKIKNYFYKNKNKIFAIISLGFSAFFFKNTYKYFSNVKLSYFLLLLSQNLITEVYLKKKIVT